jgi:hypothetical protein
LTAAEKRRLGASSAATSPRNKTRLFVLHHRPSTMSTDQQKYYWYLDSEYEQIRALEAKEWRICSWRESVSTPPESDLHFAPTKDGFNSLKRKRPSQSLDSSMATGPAKRKREQLASDGSNLDSSPSLSTPSGILSLQPRLVMSSRSSNSKSTSPERSPSPAGKLLNALRTSRPAIDCRALDDRRPVPPSVRSLRKALAKDIGVGIIPTNLKVSPQLVVSLITNSRLILANGNMCPKIDPTSGS